MSEMNPQKVIAAFRLGFLTGLLLDESYEKGEFRRLYLWSVVGGLFDATLATLGNEVDPNSQRRWGRCLEAIDIVREEDLRGAGTGVGWSGVSFRCLTTRTSIWASGWHQWRQIMPAMRRNLWQDPA